MDKTEPPATATNNKAINSAVMPTSKIGNRSKSDAKKSQIAIETTTPTNTEAKPKAQHSN